MPKINEVFKTLDKKAQMVLYYRLAPFFVSWIIFFYLFMILVWDLFNAAFPPLVLMFTVYSIIAGLGMLKSDYGQTDDEKAFIGEWRAFQEILLEDWRKSRERMSEREIHDLVEYTIYGDPSGKGEIDNYERYLYETALTILNPLWRDIHKEYDR